MCAWQWPYHAGAGTIGPIRLAHLKQVAVVCIQIEQVAGSSTAAELASAVGGAAADKVLHARRLDGTIQAVLVGLVHNAISCKILHQQL